MPGSAPTPDDELRHWLEAHGADPASRDVVDVESAWPGLGSDLVLARGAELTLRDVADRSGLPV
jgi:hypothetical protein